MKTPRLALALLALALTPFANAAAFPTWTVIEEGSRAWPEIRFSVGGKPRALHCRYAECGPKAPKGQINLFLITKKGPGAPTKVTIYKGVERSKWNPRRYTDGEWAYEPEVIAAMAYPWESELSHYKLDNTGATLFVVQGKERYPATSDIDERQFNSYDQMKIAPPKKMLDDELKPAAPPQQRSTWWCNQETGDIIGVLPGQRAPEGYTRLESRSSTCGKKPAGPSRPGRTLSKLPTAGKWKDSITAVGEWRSIQTSAYPIVGIPVPLPTMTFYCYHEKMDGDKELAAHLKKHPIIVECVNWSAPADDATKEEGGKKFKLRNNHVQFDLAFVNGKLQTMSGVKGVTVKELTALPDSLGGEKFVKVSAPQAAPAEGASLALVAGEETRWLTKDQQDAYDLLRKNAKDDDARKAADAKYRALVEAQIRPEAAAAYKAAHAAPVAEAAAKIKAAIGGVEMWGGEIKAVVPLFVEKPEGKILEVTLSKAEYDALKGDALAAYRMASIPANGESDLRRDGSTGSGRVFNEDKLDPVGLHLAVVAARKVLNPGGSTGTGTDPSAGPSGPAFDTVNLNEEQMKLLAPDELRDYKKQLELAQDPKASKETKEALYKMNKDLKELIKGRKPYVQPTDAASFSKLEDWQKKRFCADLPAPSAAIAADQSTEFKGTGKGGLADANANAPVAPADRTASSGDSGKGWSKEEAADACKKFKESLAITPQPGPGGGTGRGNQTAVVPGPDKEKAEKEKSKWLTRDLLTSAAKGAMVGLLVGSLFGPVGLIAGPLLGAAMFYGLTKITS